MSALSPRRRSALRAVVTSAALASVVLTPAAAAFADAPAVQTGSAGPVVPAAPSTPAAPAAPAAKPAGTAAVLAGTPDPKAPATGGHEQDRSARPAEQPKAESKADGSRTSGEGRRSQSGKREESVAYTLVDGHRMVVGKDRPDDFRGEVIVDGHAVLILSSDGEPDVAYWGGMRVALHPDGTVKSSWIVDSPSNPYRKGPDPHISDPGRFEGTPVSIAKGLVAVLRRDPNDGGPEAWIRAVGPNWKPGDPYIVRVVAVLNRENRTDTVGDLHLSLEGADGPAPVLKVNGKTYAFPKNAEGDNGGVAKDTSASASGARAQTTGTVALPVADAAAQTKAVPQGGVAAGAEGVVEQGDHRMLLASGGALASVGAAGIGFAVLYRRKAKGVNV